MGSATLTDVIAEFDALGFTGQFIPVPDGALRCLTCQTVTPAEDISMDTLRRLEGASDPADMAAVAALTCPHCGTKGTVVLKYGPDANVEDADVLACFVRRHAG